MIFVTVGSQKFQFNRLLEKIDTLVCNKSIIEEVYAQIGYSDYLPKNFKYERFLDYNKFAAMTKKCDLFITHGGTGAIIGAAKSGKKIIAVPRLARFGEHVDDHQIQLLKEFEKLGIILVCYDVDNLKQCCYEIYNKKFISYVSNTEKISNSIDAFLYSMRDS